MTAVFSDGESGTTGLRLRNRLSACEDVSLISLPHELRRDPSARADAMRLEREDCSGFLVEIVQG